MANNRLYLYDPESHEAFMLAKTFGEGWSFLRRPELDDVMGGLERWVSHRDHAASYGNYPKPTVLQLCTEADLPTDAVLNQESD